MKNSLSASGERRVHLVGNEQGRGPLFGRKNPERRSNGYPRNSKRTNIKQRFAHRDQREKVWAQLLEGKAAETERVVVIVLPGQRRKGAYGIGIERNKENV